MALSVFQFLRLRDATSLMSVGHVIGSITRWPCTDGDSELILTKKKKSRRKKRRSKRRRKRREWRLNKKRIRWPFEEGNEWWIIDEERMNASSCLCVCSGPSKLMFVFWWWNRFILRSEILFEHGLVTLLDGMPMFLSRSLSCMYMSGYINIHPPTHPPTHSLTHSLTHSSKSQGAFFNVHGRAAHASMAACDWEQDGAWDYICTV